MVERPKYGIRDCRRLGVKVIRARVRSGIGMSRRWREEGRKGKGER